jgi:hypothetical protein
MIIEVAHTCRGSVFWAPMNLDQISRSAIKQLRLELDRYEKRAKMKMEDRRTLPLGIAGLDLVEEYPRRFMFLRYMLKDSEEHADEKGPFRESTRSRLVADLFRLDTLKEQ